MANRTRWRRHPALMIASVWVALAGCGDSDQLPTVRVSGTLAVEGKPVGQGSIHFHPEKGRPATGIVKDGKFTLTTYSDGDGVVAGKNRIAVEVTKEVPTKDGDTTTESLIPVKFANPDRSGIEVVVPSGGFSNLQIDLVGTAAKIKEN